MEGGGEIKVPLTSMPQRQKLKLKAQIQQSKYTRNAAETQLQTKISRSLQRHTRERTLVCIETLRSDINEVGEYEVTATSELHAQAERAKKQKREDQAVSSG